MDDGWLEHYKLGDMAVTQAFGLCLCLCLFLGWLAGPGSFPGGSRAFRGSRVLRGSGVVGGKRNGIRLSGGCVGLQGSCVGLWGGHVILS